MFDHSGTRDVLKSSWLVEVFLCTLCLVNMYSRRRSRLFFWMSFMHSRDENFSPSSIRKPYRSPIPVMGHLCVQSGCIRGTSWYSPEIEQFCRSGSDDNSWSVLTRICVLKTWLAASSCSLVRTENPIKVSNCGLKRGCLEVDEFGGHMLFLDLENPDKMVLDNCRWFLAIWTIRHWYFWDEIYAVMYVNDSRAKKEASKIILKTWHCR